LINAEEYYQKALEFWQAEKYEDAFSYFKAAASKYHIEALNRLGECYLNGNGIEKNYSLAVECFQKVLMTADGHPAANYNIACCYLYGQGVKKDSEKAFAHFANAADMGHIDAQNGLAVLYLTGEGVKMNNSNAFNWLQKAFAQDPKHPRTNCNLGVCYCRGYGTKKDYEKSYACFTLAAEQGNARAQYELGRFHEQGWLGYINHVKMAECFLMAADNGYPMAQFEAAELYAMGHMVDQNWDKAMAYYHKAAEQGEVNALLKLGKYYLKGFEAAGIEKDIAKGLSFIHRSLDGGNTFAAYELQRIYEKGQFGVPVDKQKELAVCKQALTMGANRFKSYVEKLSKELGEPEQPAQDVQEAAIPAEADPVQAEKLKSALDKLQALIGLDSVKEEINNIIKLHQFNIKRKAFNMLPLHIGKNLVFTGNPGTGKTTVARLIGEIYHEIGLLDKSEVVEVKRTDLVAEYIGQTAPKTQNCLNNAMGGILFIDEAYTLHKESPRDFGHEAVETILTAMEENRDHLMVIAAGYEKQMQKFLDINPGLKSRFGNFIHFEDYKPAELCQIFYKMLADSNNQIEDAARPLLENYFERIYRTRDDEFGNARDVRNFFDTVIKQKINRLGSIEEYNPQDFILTKEDIQAAIDKLLGKLNEAETPAIEQLQAMTGLSRVKEEVTELNQMAIYQKMCRERGVLLDEPPTMHMVFSGNPGTGKTTVARLVGKIYKELGLLPKGHVVEVKREHLVGNNIGDTAPKTKEAIKRAVGGVLFIDEAYTLNQGGENDFGTEAINVLLTEMENKRESLAVIVAGYQEEIRDFINSNPGLESRFTRYIHFDDYTGQELAQIFRDIVQQKRYTFGEGAEAEVDRICAEMYDKRDNNFGNAREVRNLFDAVIQSLAARVSVLPNPTVQDLTQLTKADILAAERKQKQKQQHNQKPEPPKPRKIGFIANN